MKAHKQKSVQGTEKVSSTELHRDYRKGIIQGRADSIMSRSHYKLGANIYIYIYCLPRGGSAFRVWCVAAGYMAEAFRHSFHHFRF